VTTALITGVSGQDGSYLAEQLLEQGLRVVGVHRRLSSPNHWRLAGVLDRLEMRSADLADQTCWLDLLEQEQPDEIYHLAAQSFVPTSWKQPLWTAQATGLGTVRLLEAVRRVVPGALVYQASSSEMFGNPPTDPQNEDTPFSPCSPYAAAKLYAHHMARCYRDAYGLRIHAGILFNHESPRRGSGFVTRKIARAAARIKRGLQQELLIGDITVRRDWGFAGDYTLAMQAILRNGRRFDYVVATGCSHSVEDLLSAAFEAVDLDWRDHTRADPALLRRNEVRSLRGDATRARDHLGWRPEMAFGELVQLLVQTELKRCVSS
jgi:GDPmannose 4,6-dehydratase